MDTILVWINGWPWWAQIAWTYAVYCVFLTIIKIQERLRRQSSIEDVEELCRVVAQLKAYWLELKYGFRHRN